MSTLSFPYTISNSIIILFYNYYCFAHKDTHTLLSPYCAVFRTDYLVFDNLSWLLFLENRGSPTLIHVCLDLEPFTAAWANLSMTTIPEGYRDSDDLFQRSHQLSTAPQLGLGNLWAPPPSIQLESPWVHECDGRVMSKAQHFTAFLFFRLMNLSTPFSEIVLLSIEVCGRSNTNAPFMVNMMMQHFCS